MQLVKWALAAGLMLAGLALPPVAQAGDVSCRMTFQLSGWSVFYKTASGTGSLTGTNTYSGGTEIQQGTLEVNSPAALTES